MTRNALAQALGMLAVLIGGAAVLVSFVGLDWYRYPGRGANRVTAVTFADLAANDNAPGMPGVVATYFDWLGWVLLIVAVAVGAIAKFASRSTAVLGAAGLLVGAAGTATTYWAAQEVSSFGDEGGYALRSASVGLWFALGGFLLAGIGAVIGPRPV